MTSAEIRDAVLAEYRASLAIIGDGYQAMTVVVNRFANRVAMAVSRGDKPLEYDVLSYDLAMDMLHGMTEGRIPA